MEFIFSSVLGTVFYSLFIFMAGGLIWPKLWNWVKSFLPWEKE